MEQTASKRFRAHLPVIFSRDGHPGEARGLASSLSTDGCTMTSDTRVTAGMYLALRLQLPAPHAPVEIGLAVVRWTQGWDFSVGFLHMPSDKFLRLSQYLAALEPVDAAS